MCSSARRSTAKSRSAPACRRALTPDDVDLDRALALLSLPREVGRHPEDGEPIRAGIGRFGPYVQHGKTYANLEAGDDIFHIGLNRAVTLIAEKRAKGPRFRRFGADPGRALGDHPTKGGPVVAKNGRYGPYVSHDGINATLPRDKTPETITLDEAVALLDARAERGATAPHARRRNAKRAAPGAARQRQKAGQRRRGDTFQTTRNPQTPRKTTPSCRIIQQGFATIFGQRRRPMSGL